MLSLGFCRAKISYHSEPPASQILPPYLTEDKIAEMQAGFNLKKLEEENSSTVQGTALLPLKAIVAAVMGDHEWKLSWGLCDCFVVMQQA